MHAGLCGVASSFCRSLLASNLHPTGRGLSYLCLSESLLSLALGSPLGLNGVRGLHKGSILPVESALDCHDTRQQLRLKMAR